MFDSGIKAKDLIEDLKSEVDIATEIPDKTYVLWLNALQQMLYSEIIKFQRDITLPSSELNWDTNGWEKRGYFELPGFSFEDIHAVFVARGFDYFGYSTYIQLAKATLASSIALNNVYYKVSDNKVGYRHETTGKDVYEETIRIVYFAKPELITIDKTNTISADNVALPIEFIELAKAKLRGEAYKLANEDGLAAKWLNDYNVLLETFKVWVSKNPPTFDL